MEELCLLSPLPPVTHLSYTPNQHLMNRFGYETQMRVVHFNVRERSKEKEKDNRGRAIRSLSLKIAVCPWIYTHIMQKHNHTICPLQFCQFVIRRSRHLFIFHSAFITLLICCLLVITLVSCCQFSALCSFLLTINNFLQKSCFVLHWKIKV